MALIRLVAQEMTKRGNNAVSTTATGVGWGLWLQWLAATAIGWGAGEAVASFVPEDTLLLGTVHSAVIGLVLGTMQWLILRRYIAMARRWVLATLIGSAVGGAIGLAASFAAGATVIQPWALLPFGIALGVCQWFVLRSRCRAAAWWTVAYALGLPLSFIVGLVVSFSVGFEWENVDAIFRVVSLAFFGAVAGAVFGMLSGGLLVWFLRRPRKEAKLATAF